MYEVKTIRRLCQSGEVINKVWRSANVSKSACLVVNPITFNNFASLVFCMPVASTQ